MPGWLDEVHDELRTPDAAEEKFIALAQRAWRHANAKGKRELAGALRQSLKARET